MPIRGPASDFLPGRPALLAFGALAVLAGVGAHLPMFVMSAPSFRMASMPTDVLMLAGMAAIVLGSTSDLSQ